MHRPPRSPLPLLCAALFCLANAFKPAVIDDLAYLWYARQIVAAPAHPFGPPPDGFHLIWYDRGQGAFSLLTPMVVPYWLALGLAFFGENLVLLKLWLFPFCWLLTASLSFLLRRYARGFERPFLLLTVFSPALLPSLNLMVDVPALALGLAAVVLFLKAVTPPRTRWPLVLLAGGLAGLAAQAKYNGTTAAAVVLLAGLLRRRRSAGLLAAAVAAAIFVGWEAYLSHVYGRSHFLLQLEQRRAKPAEVVPDAGPLEKFGTEVMATLVRKAGLVVPLAGVLGGLNIALIPLALTVLRGRKRRVIAVAVLAAGGLLAMALIPEPWAVFYRNPERKYEEVTVSTLFAGACGFAVISLLARVAGALGFRRRERKLVRRRDRRSWFLIGWLAVELAGCFALSPFAAARRVLGLEAVAALLLARLASATCRSPERRRLVRGYCVFGVLLGGVFAWTDYRDAVVEKKAVSTCADWVRQQPGGTTTVWFCGHWGFQYYGEELSLRAVYPGESVLHEGDWLLYPDDRLRPYMQLVRLEPEWAEKMAVFEFFEAWPLRTNPEFYDGYQPVRRHEGPRLRVTVFRVRRTFRAQPG
jgi:hypothetical protein